MKPEQKTVRYCGSCIHFSEEDINGRGWCTASNHPAECDEEACEKWDDGVCVRKETE